MIDIEFGAVIRQAASGCGWLSQQIHLGVMGSCSGAVFIIGYREAGESRDGCGINEYSNIFLP